MTLEQREACIVSNNLSVCDNSILGTNRWELASQKAVKQRNIMLSLLHRIYLDRKLPFLVLGSFLGMPKMFDHQGVKKRNPLTVDISISELLYGFLNHPGKKE